MRVILLCPECLTELQLSQVQEEITFHEFQLTESGEKCSFPELDRKIGNTIEEFLSCEECDFVFNNKVINRNISISDLYKIKFPEFIKEL